MIKNMKPAAPKKWLYLTAGAMWSAVGLWLCWLAYGWLALSERNTIIAMSSAGFILAMLIYTFGFSLLANRNIYRINQYTQERVCIFAFQSWSSYPLVAFMIALGIFLRTSSWIPKPYLGAMYLGIGGSLFLASFHYYRYLAESNKQPNKGKRKSKPQTKPKKKKKKKK